MKKIILSVLLLSVTAIAGAQEPVAIVKQGHFSVGGKTTQRPGAYDNRKFVGWVEQEETGQVFGLSVSDSVSQCPEVSVLIKIGQRADPLSALHYVNA